MPERVLSLGLSLVSWIEHYLVHGPGDVQGQPIELDDEFAAFIVKAYRLNADGSRRVRRAFLSRAKGRSKSGIAAMLVCVEALGPCRFDHFAVAGEVSEWGYEYDEGEPVGRPLTYVEILNVATEEGQAGNTYDAVHYMLNPETCSPNLVATYGRLDVGLTRVSLPDARGFIEPVTSSDSSKDGGKSTFIVADETHLWILPRLKRLHRIMNRNLLKRKVASGWMLETSTMYGEGEGSVAEGTHAYAKRVAAGEERDATLLFDHRQAADSWNLAKRSQRMKALRESYGPAAAWMNLEAICDSWDDPETSEAEFRRYWLNQPVPTEEPPPTELPQWPACAVEKGDRPDVEGLGIAVSLDGQFATLAEAGRWDDDTVNVGVMERRRGTGWVVAEAKQLQDDTGCRVAIVKDGTGSFLIPKLEDAGVDFDELGLGDYAAACGLVGDDVDGLNLTHMEDDDLERQIPGAVKRYVGDGRWVWARRGSTGDIDALEAITCARVAVDRNVEADPSAMFV